jgi:Transmembrane domain of unknown function (DUF3566)
MHLPFGDNLVGNLPEEDRVDQGAEPPPWLPEGTRPATGADLRSPEDGDAGQAESSEAASYEFGRDTEYQNGQEATYHLSSGAGYGYVDDTPPEGTSVIPPYGAAPEAGAEPASASEPVPVPGVPGPHEGANRTTTFAAAPRGRYLAGGGAPATETSPADPAAAPAISAPAPGGAAAAAARPVRPGPGGPGGPAQVRRADLVLSRLEPWSVMKFSFLMSLVAWVVLFVAVAFLYFVLSGLGVFTSLQHTLGSVTSSSGSSGVNLSHWFSASRILGYTMLLGAVNIVLITALSTVGAMIYNLVTHLGGGIEVTLRETD